MPNLVTLATLYIYNSLDFPDSIAIEYRAPSHVLWPALIASLCTPACPATGDEDQQVRGHLTPADIEKAKQRAKDLSI